MKKLQFRQSVDACFICKCYGDCNAIHTVHQDGNNTFTDVTFAERQIKWNLPFWKAVRWSFVEFKITKEKDI